MISLVRDNFSNEFTLGKLLLPDHTFYTVERPWLNNTPFVSCIPEGEYLVQPYSSKKYPNVWEVTGVPGRSKILIHGANWAYQLQGCIAPGMVRSNSGVASSQVALAIMRRNLPKEFMLNITNEIPEYP